MSGGVDSFHAAWPISSGRVMEKLCDPGRLHARAKAVALTREIEVLGCDGMGSELLDVRGRCSGKLETGEGDAEALGAGAFRTLGEVPVGAGSLICGLERNSIRPSDQSINGLCCRSQFIPRTMGQFGTSEVT
jgi:hypothetical protein